MLNYSSVAIVDDNPDNLTHLKSILSPLFEVSTYSSYKEFTHNDIYDLYLIDLVLPDGCGIELAKIISQKPNYSNAPILIITSYPAPDTKLESLKISGVCEYLDRFVDDKDLIAILLKKQKEYISSLNTLSLGNLKLEKDFFNCEVNDSIVDLTRNEFLFLKGLMQNNREVFETKYDEIFLDELSHKLERWDYKLKFNHGSVIVSRR